MIGRLLRGLSHVTLVALILSFFLSPAPSWAMRRNMSGRERAPYGISEGGEYGEQREIGSAEQAQSILKEYFSKKDVKIGKITEKKLYFEAEIRDREGNLVDVVIVDKRTGRIRSIY